MVCTLGSPVGSNPGPIFLAFFVTCLAEKIGFPCTHKACQKKRKPYFSTLCATVMFFSTRGCLAFFKVSGREGFTIPEAPTSRQNEWAK